MSLLLLLACQTGPDLPDYGPVPDFSLTDQTGATVRSADLKGHPWLANFIFTSCATICPMLSTQMAGFQAEFADWPALRLVSFTVDPARDTPEVLASYGARFGAQAGRWYFLTGPPDVVKTVVTDGFKQMMEAVLKADGTPDVLHSQRYVVVDDAGMIRGFPSEEAEIREILKALR